jgi:Outer membrane protein beta-barrel domain
MKRIVSVMAAAGIALALGTTAANAQVSLGVGGGITLPTGNFKDGAKTGWNGVAVVGYSLPSGVGVRGDFYYGEHKAKVGSAKAKLAGGLGNVFYAFQTAGSVKPYIIGSAGMMNAKAPGFSETKFTWGGGAGIKFKAGSDASIFVEGRYLSISTSGDKTNIIPISAGVSFGLK